MSPMTMSPRRAPVVAFGVLASTLVATGCFAVTRDPEVKPGPPVPAERELDLENMDTECAGMIAAYDRYATCPNLEDAERQWVRDVIEAAEKAFAAGKKANPDEPSQRAIAMACRRATTSIGFATERCLAGKRPRIED